MEYIIKLCKEIELTIKQKLQKQVIYSRVIELNADCDAC